MNTFDHYLNNSGEVGQVESVLQSIIHISGLPSARLNELVITDNNQPGIVKSIDEELVEIMLLTSERVFVGQRVTRTGERIKVGVSSGLLGRIVNSLVDPIDGLGPILGDKEARYIYNRAPSIVERVRVSDKLDTGVPVVDFMVPLGKGQRELLLGDQKTGKTTFLLQTMVKQAKAGSVCVYVGIGKKKSDIKNVESYLKKAGIFQKCVILFAASSEPASLVFLAPYSGMSIAEYFRDKGEDVLVAFDDLTNHAKFYREISLLSKVMPGRESYPGDIFHIHAALLERAGRVSRGDKQFSITALPVVETVQGDLTGYLPTNAMAMTDGHIFFDSAEFKKGRRPAVNVPLSVTRVGNQTQSVLEQNIRKSLVEKFNLYHKAQGLAHFGFDLPLKTRGDLNFGERLEAIFDQDSQSIIDRKVAMLLLGMVLNNFWSGKSIDQLRVERTKITGAYESGAFGNLADQLNNIQDVESLKSLTKNSEKLVENVLYSKIPQPGNVNQNRGLEVGNV